MTPGMMLAVIEDADAVEPKGNRRIILELRAPTVLGISGRFLRRETGDGQGDEGGPVYGFTRRQARQIRGIILAAAAEDAQAAPGPADDGFGDGVDT